MAIEGFLFDLDGVFYISKQLIDGANNTILWLKNNNLPYRFVTNTSTLSRSKLSTKLSSYGLDINQDEIISANYAGVLYLQTLQPQSCRLILKEDAKDDYRQFNIDETCPEYIIIGDIDNQWNYELMNELFNLALQGSKIVSLHKGKYYQTDAGLQIDSGAFIKGIEYAAGVKSHVIGKPEKDFFNLAINDLGLDNDKIAMIGDDLINDIQGSNDAGICSILVKTGKYRQEIFDKSTISPDYIINSIQDLPILYNKYLNL